METFQISRAFTLIEPGPVVLVTTHDGTKNNIMTISWNMVVDQYKRANDLFDKKFPEADSAN